jgi:hypothetical protein
MRRILMKRMIKTQTMISSLFQMAIYQMKVSKVIMKGSVFRMENIQAFKLIITIMLASRDF